MTADNPAARVDLDALTEEDRQLADRLWSRVEKTNTCWLWTGHLSKGYGNIRINGKTLKVHRYAWMLLRGPIPNGYPLDHLCRIKNCVNPDHLEPVPQRVNVVRGIGPTAINARKTHCKHGHEFTPENTYRRSDGDRECQTCRADLWRKQRARWGARAALADPEAS